MHFSILIFVECMIQLKSEILPMKAQSNAHRLRIGKKKKRRVSAQMSMLLEFLVRNGLYRKLTVEQRFFIIQTVFPGIYRSPSIPLLPYYETFFDDKTNRKRP